MTSAMKKIEKYLERMGLRNYEVYLDGFLVHAPGTYRNVTIRIVVKDPYLGITAFFMPAPQKNREKLYKRLLELNKETFMVKWSIDSEGDIFISSERLLRDLDFSEFEAAMTMTVSAIDDHTAECESMVE
jgi:hypothetical protein